MRSAAVPNSRFAVFFGVALALIQLCASSPVFAQPENSLTETPTESEGTVSDRLAGGMFAPQDAYLQPLQHRRRRLRRRRRHRRLGHSDVRSPQSG